MNKLDRLIAKLCPDGVELVPLKTLAEIGTGNSDRINAIDDGAYPFYVRSKTIYRSNRYLYDEEAIIIPGEGGIGDIFHYAQGKYDLHQRAYRIHFLDEIVDTKYAYYYFTTTFKKFILMKAVNATVTSIRKPMIENFPFPLIPLPIQQEIVRILDKFTGLTAELTAELTARKKQYEYYRNELLTFGADVPMIPLAQITNMKAGKFIQAVDIFDKRDNIFCYPCYGANGLRGYVKNYNYEGTYLLIGRQGAFCGNVNRITDKFYATEHAVVMNARPDVNIDYLFHMLVYMNLNQYASKSAQPGLAVSNIEKLIIPVPRIVKQKRIATILDRFDALTNDITDGLPAEIEARRKQYEYYRNKLLTFKEKAA